MNIDMNLSSMRSRFFDICNQQAQMVLLPEQFKKVDIILSKNKKSAHSQLCYHGHGLVSLHTGQIKTVRFFYVKLT